MNRSFAVVWRSGCFTTLLVLQLTGQSCRAADSVSVPLGNPVIEGGVNAPVTAEPVTVKFQGQEFSGVKLTLRHRSSWNAVRFPVNVSAQTNNTLEFKARFDTGETELRNFGLSLRDKAGLLNGTNFSKRATNLGDGWYQFTWDVINQPDNVQGADLAAVTEFQIKYPFPNIPDGQIIHLDLIDMKFTAGKSVRSGDPELYQKWKTYIARYKPDYGDSSAYLEPPLTGRISRPIPLVRKNKALGSIMVPKDATGALTAAGQELRHWLTEITGAEFPVTTIPGDASTPQILLGKQFAAGKFDADLAALGNTDGFAVRTVGSRIHIFGNTDKGTLNGVLAFLENNTDLIWPRPMKELGAVFSRRSDLDVVWADAREIPSTRLRGWATNLGMRAEHESWSNHNRNNYPKGGGGVKFDALRRAEKGNYVEFGGGHNISGFLGDNPKAFYPTIDGVVPDKFNIWKHQPNFTAPGLPETVAANVLKYVREKAPEHIDCVNVNIEDNWGLSTDAKSLEPIKLPDGSLLPSTDPAFRSTQYFIFLNEVARRIQQTRPGMMVGTYAYFFTAIPPKVPVEKNIRVYFCPYVRKDHRAPLCAPINDVWWTRLEQWAKATPNVVIREYYGIMNGFRPLAEVVGFDVRSYLQRGVREYTSELNPDEKVISDGTTLRGGRDEWDFMAMEFWVINRLYWNADQDVEQLRKYYLRRTYREAAPAMERFFGTIREGWYRQSVPSAFEEPDKIMRSVVLQAGIEGQLRGFLDEAAAVAKHPVSKMSVDVLRLRFEQWLRWAKEPGTRKLDETLGLIGGFQFGWSPNNDWGNNRVWASATYVSREGKTLPAVRLEVMPDRTPAADAILTNVCLKGLKAGSRIPFVMERANGGVLPRFELMAVTKNNQRLVAPQQAFRELPDGSVQVDWVLDAQAVGGKPFDFSELTRINLTFPAASITGESTNVFYMTKLEIGNPENER